MKEPVASCSAQPYSLFTARFRQLLVHCHGNVGDALGLNVAIGLIANHWKCCCCGMSADHQEPRQGMQLEQPRTAQGRRPGVIPSPGKSWLCMFCNCTLQLWAGIKEMPVLRLQKCRVACFLRHLGGSPARKLHRPAMGSVHSMVASPAEAGL